MKLRQYINGLPDITGVVSKIISDCLLVYLRVDHPTTTTHFDVSEPHALYYYCRQYNIPIEDDRTNVERYIQDGKLL